MYNKDLFQSVNTTKITFETSIPHSIFPKSLSYAMMGRNTIPYGNLLYIACIITWNKKRPRPVHVNGQFAPTVALMWNQMSYGLEYDVSDEIYQKCSFQTTA